MDNGVLNRRIQYWLKRVKDECPNNSAEYMSCIRIITDLELQINEAKKTLLNKPALFSYEEIAVPDAWSPWFEEYFGVNLREEEERRL